MQNRARVGFAAEGRLARFLARYRSKKRPPRFSTVLRLMGIEAGERIRLSDLAVAFGDRAFGALLFIFAAPNALPLPPGASAVLGLPLLVIAFQFAIGRPVAWLPAFIAGRSIARQDFQHFIDRALPYLRWCERFLAPRFGFMFGPVQDRLSGIACLALALVLFLPIPLGNMLPGLAISLFALALLQRDGVAALLAWMVSAVSIAVVVAISGALWAAAKAFFHALPWL